jgi:hypothetical protein
MPWADASLLDRRPLEHAEWLDERGRNGEAGPLAAEAREIFERLEATPWVERASRLGAEVRV